MRISDLARIALKTLKGRWAVIPAAAVAISMFCLCYAGAILYTVSEEKSRPYELIISARSSELYDKNAVKISKLPGVSAVTPVIDIPVKIEIGDYSADITLSGIYDSYIADGFDEGGVFPESSVMPYIVLNKAACRQFAKQEETYITGDISGMYSDEADTAVMPDIDWLKSEAVIRMDSVSVTAKICGILSADDKEGKPEAYVSLFVAKQLRFQNGGNAAYSGAKARVENMGIAQSVSASVESLGFGVENSNSELQSKWDRESDEMVFLTITGAFSLICFAVLLIMLRKVSRLEYRKSWLALKWIGFREKDILLLYIFQSFFLSLIGIIIGLIISLALPSFLPAELLGISVLMLNIPFGSALISSLICAAAGIIPASFNLN